MQSSVIFPNVDAAVAHATQAQRLFHEQSLELRRGVIQAIREAALVNAERWARLTVEETKMGRAEDKTQKNKLCALRTPGVEDLQSKAYTGDKGLTLVEYAPFGVVASITPSNNPAATIISNSISILAAGNAVIFAPHPETLQVCHDVLKTLSHATVVAGAPAGLITSVGPPSHETTRELLAHPGINLNLVTGGTSIVDFALSISKSCKTIAAGPGNPPVVIDETANFPQCVQDVVFGASFDNNLLCIAEKEVIVVEAARAQFLASISADSRAYELSTSQMDRLAKIVIHDCSAEQKASSMNRNYVGRDASFLAALLDLDVPASTRLLWGVVPEEHPFIWIEQLMPVLPVTFVADVEQAIDLAVRAEAGNHHTAAMYSTHIGNLTRMGRRMQCSVFVNNAPTLYGLGMGEGYTSMSIGTPTGDGITKTSHFVRPLHYCLVGYFRIT